jgi:hypothetical protein
VASFLHPQARIRPPARTNVVGLGEVAEVRRGSVREQWAMETLMSAVADEEIVGIVISRGSRAQETPRFSMYVWGPVDPEPEAAEQQVA